MDSTISNHFGCFERLEPLGSGGGGDVFLARRRGTTDATLVLKLAAPGQEAALHREWHALHDVPSGMLPEPVAWLPQQSGQPAAIVMTRRPGRTLAQALAGATPHAVAVWMATALRGLGALHAAGCVHGDLHPGNLLVGTDVGDATLLDLGLSQRPGEPVQAIGRLAFAAPDRVRQGFADPRDDLFSLALSVWFSWGFPPPYPDYPALLPVPGQRPILPEVPGDRADILRVLSGWMAPAREHRPADAEQALREWLQMCGIEQNHSEQLKADLAFVRDRPWRWGRWPGVPQVPELPRDGRPMWVIGPSGSGRSGALVSLVAAAQATGHVALRLVPGNTADPLLAAWQLLGQREPQPDHDDADDAVGMAALAEPAAAEIARWQGRFDALRCAIGADGLLAADDWEQWPAAARAALAAWSDGAGNAAALALAGSTAIAGDAEAVWLLPSVCAAEVGAALTAACAGRVWDAGVVADLAAFAGGSRAALFPVAAAALASGALDVAADRVDVADSSAWRAWIAAAAGAKGDQTLPPQAWWPVAAAAALGGRVHPDREGSVAPRLALGPPDRMPLLRRVDGGGIEVADAAARDFLLARLPPGLLAQTARESAAQLPDHSSESVRLRLLAASWDGGAAPAPTAVAACLRGMVAAADAERAVTLAKLWQALPAGCSVAEAAAVAAAHLSALTALGRFAEARAASNALAPAVHANDDVQIALAELGFRCGDYPDARQCAQRVLDTAEGAHAVQAWMWLAFSATWQGDHAVAAQANQSGRFAALGDAQALAVFEYLGALHHYYSGRLDAADTVFARLCDARWAHLRAAAAGGRGLCAHRRGDLEAARGLYETARKCAEQAGDRARALNMAMNVAVLDHEAGDLGRALAGYDRVIAAARRLGQTGALQRAQQNRGNLLTLIGFDAEARADLEGVLGGLTEAGNAYLEGNVRCLLAEIDRRGDRFVDAAQHLERAAAGLSLAGAQSELSEISLESGYLALARGDVAAARSLAREVRAAAAALNSAELQARSLWLDASCRLDGAAAVPTPSELRAVVEDLTTAQGIAPTAKPLLRAGIAADRARALAFTGAFAQARQLAREQLAALQRVGATLDLQASRRFARAPCHAAMRGTLQILANLPESADGASFGLAHGHLHPVLAINRRLGMEHDLAALLEIVMDSAVLLTGAERGFLLLDEAGDSEGEIGDGRARSRTDMRVAVARNLDRENLRKPQHKLSQTIATRVFETGERVLSVDAQADERWREQASIHAGSLRSILCVPLTSRGRAIGVLYVDNRFTSGAFTAEHADLLEALADQAGIAIQTARLIARQRATAEALARSRSEVEQLNAQLQAQLADVATALDTARADLSAQRHDLARRSEYAQIRGESAPLHRLFALMDRVRDHDFPVLVRGESGTGKELVARSIHFTGRRKQGPFIAINCGALPSNLLESELFGHARGAFTGAVAERRGLFESANGGTLLLDEVGDMPPEMQVKLLRVLQSGELQRVGDSAVRRVDVRVVAATHRDLAALVGEGTFREDLLYRLRVVELEVPPLRRRLEDLPLLIEHFLAENLKAGVGKIERISPAALARLRQFAWPGNVRQLETTLKSACLFASSTVLDVSDVEPLLLRDRAPSEAVAAAPAQGNWSLTATLADIEAQVIRARIEACGGNKRQAAESLGIDRGTLYNRLRS